MSILKQDKESKKERLGEIMDTKEMEVNGREDTLKSSTTQTTSRRLTDIEVQRRVDRCFDLRYKAEKPILQREWIELCRKAYGDKSIPTYTHYWMKAKNDYDEQWRANLEGMLRPAMLELQQLLNSDNPMIKQKAIDQIIKYSGNDVQKHLVAIQDITIGFGED